MESGNPGVITVRAEESTWFITRSFKYWWVRGRDRADKANFLFSYRIIDYRLAYRLAMVKALLKSMIYLWGQHPLEALPADPSAWAALQFGKNRAGEICKVGQKKNRLLVILNS